VNSTTDGGFTMNDSEQVADRPDSDLAALADECRREAGSDIARAADLMIARVQHNEPLYRRLHDPLTRNACLDWLKRSYAGSQESEGPLPRVPAVDQEARARARAEATRQAMEAVRTRR
jgi:hypothetical protein